MKKEFLKEKGTWKVTFSLPKKAVNGARQVVLVGDFNNWDTQGIALEAIGSEVYETTLELNPGRSYQYRYLIDNNRWENDWQADQYIPSPFNGVNNSVVVLHEVAPEPIVKNGIHYEQEATSEAHPTIVENLATENIAKPVTVQETKVEYILESPINTEETTKKKAKPANAKKKTVEIAANLATEIPSLAPIVENKSSDDLTKIEGIGKKLEEVLNDVGIKTYEALSKLSADDIKAMLIAVNPRYKMHNPTFWSQEAALAAAGKWEELQALQTEIKNGKKK